MTIMGATVINVPAITTALFKALLSLMSYTVSKVSDASVNALEILFKPEERSCRSALLKK